MTARQAKMHYKSSKLPERKHIIMNMEKIKKRKERRKEGKREEEREKRRKREGKQRKIR